MRYQKLRGKSTSELMMRIRAEFGQSALIMATREVREGGILGSGLLSKKLFEIEFMVPEAAARRTGRSSATQDEPTEANPSEIGQGNAQVRAASFRRVARPADGRPSVGEGDVGAAPRRVPSVDEILKTETSAEEILALLNRAEGTAGQQRQHTGDLDDASGGLFDGDSAMIGRAAALQAQPVPVSSEPSIRFFHKIRSRFLGAHLSREFIDTFLSELDQKLSSVDKKEYRLVEERALKQLSDHIRAVPDVAPTRGECRAVMLVGPTGSGKTTSLAKLAARYHLYENREVSIYSLDHYRLAATEQLKTYAGVMGVPFHSPVNAEEFAEQIRRDGAELMLIDTSGIGHRDLARINELKRFVAACEVRLEKHLVLAANMSPFLVEKILLAYDALGFDKILLTKLDESDFIGAFIEHADKFNRPFSFLTNGQEVPGDIQEARPDEMARMVLKTELRAEPVNF